MFINIFNINPEALSLLYATSYVIFGSTSLFLYTRKTKRFNNLFLWLFFWGVFYGLHEFFELLFDLNGSVYINYLSSLFKYLSYLFLSFIPILSPDIYPNRFVKKRFIFIFSIILFIVFRFFTNSLFLIPFLVSMVISWSYYKTYRDPEILKTVRKYALTILILFFLFGITSVLEGLNSYFTKGVMDYIKISRILIAWFLTLSFLFYFIEDISFFNKPKYYKVLKRFIFLSFLLFLFLVVSINIYFVKITTNHMLGMSTFKRNEGKSFLEKHNKYQNNFYRENEIFSESVQVKKAMSTYISGTSTENIDFIEAKKEVYAMFDSLKKEETQVMYILDKDGNTIISSNRLEKYSFEGKNYSFRPYFKEALNGKNSVYYAKGVTSGKKGSYFATPIYADESRKNIQGVFVSKVTSNEYSSFYSNDEGVFLLAKDGFVFSSNIKNIIDKKLFVSEFYQNDLKENSIESGLKIIDEFVAEDINKKTYFYKIIDIYPEGWQIGFFEKHEHIDAIILKRIYYSVALFAIYMLVFYFIISYFIDTLILQIAENNYKNIFNNTSNFIFNFNSDDNIIFVNPAWKNIFGYIDRDIKKISIKDILTTESYLVLKKEINENLDNYDRKTIELDFINKRGEHILGLGSIEKENRGEKYYIIRAVFRDNTKEKKWKDQIKKTNLELEKLLKKSENDKKNKEIQRQATLNILEDVSEGQAKLEKFNAEIQRKSRELEALAVLTNQFATISDIEKLIEKTQKYFSSNFQLTLVAFLLNRDYENSSIFYKIFLNKKYNVSLKYIEKVKKSFLLANNKEKFVKSNIFKLTSAEIDGTPSRNSKVSPKSEFFLKIQAENKFFGYIYLSSQEKNFFSRELVTYLNTIAASFSVALSNIQIINRDQHSKTFSLVKTLSNGIMMFDLQRKLTLINPAGKKFCGVSTQGEGLENFFIKTKEYNLEKLLSDALKNGGINSIDELKITTNNVEFIYQTLLTPIHDAENKIIGAAIVLQDVTHLKYIDRMKTEFVSVASHQLRTPLTAIKLFTEMLVNEQVGKITKEQKEYLSNVYDSTERMVGLVNDLLNVTRIESGRLIISPVPTDIDSFLSSLIQEAKALAEIKKIKIKFSCKKKMPLIPIDHGLMRQVYHNLLTNAIRYTKEGGNVKIIVSTKGENLTVAVSDAGIGIPKKSQQRIFEKFFRAENAVKIVTEGTGLGLYVSKMIVESSGGKISFVSKENIGTTFYVSLPKKGMKKRKGERGLSIS